MPSTAWATTATAAILSPCNRPLPSASPAPATLNANSTMAMAEGNVNPSQAAKPPAKPARKRPTPMPTWLLAGPGKNWHSATRSA